MLVHVGGNDLDFGCSVVCPILIGQMRILHLSNMVEHL